MYYIPTFVETVCTWIVSHLSYRFAAFGVNGIFTSNRLLSVEMEKNLLEGLYQIQMEKTFILLVNFLLLANCYCKAKANPPFYIHQDEFGIVCPFDANKIESFVLKFDYQNDTNYLVRGIEKLSKGDYKEAIIDLTKAIELNPESSEAYCKRGFAYFHLNYKLDAFDDFDKAIKLNPKHAEAYLGLGNVFAETSTKDAFDYYAKAIEIDRKLKQVYLDRGWYKLYLERYEDAIEDFNRYIELDPYSPKAYKAYFHRGFAKAEIEFYRSNINFTTPKDYNDAIEDFNTAISLNPNDAEVYFYRGRTKYRFEEFSGAMLDYKRAIELNPDDWRPYYFRAVAKKKFGDFRGAIIDLNKVIELDPEDGRAFSVRGEAKIKLGQIESGCLDLSKAGELGYSMAYWLIEKYCN